MGTHHPRRIVLVLALLLVAMPLAACADSGERTGLSVPEGLDSLEVDDNIVDLPHTQLVLCTPEPEDKIEFVWTGSNILTPRRPTEEDRWSNVLVRMTADFAAPTEVSLRIISAGQTLDLGFGKDQENGELSLRQAGPSHYVVFGTIAQVSDPERLHNLRIEFTC